MPKKANLEDLAELRNRPGKMSCISLLTEVLWNKPKINVRAADTCRKELEIIKTIIRLL